MPSRPPFIFLDFTRNWQTAERYLRNVTGEWHTLLMMKGSVLLLMFLSGLISISSIVAEEGILVLQITDHAGTAPTPARVEIRDSLDRHYVADDALPFGGDCSNSEEPTGLTNLERTLATFTRTIRNPYTRTTQFYSTGRSRISLPAGTYYLLANKGLEYKAVRDTIRIVSGQQLEHTLRMQQWINMPGRGWYGADDHLHIPRPIKEIDPYILGLIQAEDIHVANLLQIGKALIFEHSPQYAFGPDGSYQQGNYIVASGQENPRTHFLGHAITLGTEGPLHDPDRYLIYRYIWAKAIEQGGINGFAHGNEPESYILSAHKGVSLILPHHLMHFLEVMAFNRHDYSLWYDILNLGFKVAPTAGTDFPCGDNLPGHERFYTKVDTPFNYENWLEGVRRGRTFITKGPMLEFRIDGEDIGSEKQRLTGDSLQITGSVFADPAQDELNYIEVVENGEVIWRTNDVAGKERVDFGFYHPVSQTSWYAVRGIGDRKMETLYQEEGEPTVSSTNPKSPFHSAPIYITVSGKPNAQLVGVAQRYLDRLHNMEMMLAEQHLDILARHIQNPDWDNVPREVLIANRDELLEEIKVARQYFTRLIEGHSSQ